MGKMGRSSEQSQGMDEMKDIKIPRNRKAGCEADVVDDLLLEWTTLSQEIAGLRGWRK